MLKLDLRPLLQVRGISQPYSFLRGHGFTHNIAWKLLSGKSRECRYHHIEKLCRLLLCTPNDLLVWKPDENEVYPDNLPLRELMVKPETVNIEDEMSKMSFGQMVRFKEKVADLLKEEAD